MLVNITHDTKAEHARLFAAGVAFITVMALLIGLSIAIYNKAFSHPTMVTIKAQNAGLQLAKFGDVRRHGALVGHVREIGNDGKQAVIKVALVPAAAKNIPENVSVEILPTTLFGQKYISLVGPDRPRPPKSLSNGDVIPASRVQHQRRAAEDPRRPVPAAALDPARRPELDPLRAGHGAARSRRRARRDLRQARQLPDHDERPPADAPAGPRAARPGQQDLLHRGARPGPPAAQRHHDGAHRDRQGVAAADLLRRRDRPRQDLDAGADRPTRPTSSGRRGQPAAARPAGHLLARSSRACSRVRRATPGGSTRSSGTARCGRACTSRPPSAAPTTSATVPSYGEHGHGPQCYGLPYPKLPLEPPVNFKNGTELDSTSGGNPAMSTPQHQDHPGRDQARDLRPRQPDRHRHADRDHGLLRLRQRDRVQGRLHLGQPDPEGRRRPGRRRDRRLGQGRGDQGPRQRRGHLQGQEGRARHHGDAGLDPLPQPGRRPLHGARGGHAGRASGSPTAAPSRPRARRRR